MIQFKKLVTRIVFERHYGDLDIRIVELGIVQQAMQQSRKELQNTKEDLKGQLVTTLIRPSSHLNIF